MDIFPFSRPRKQQKEFMEDINKVFDSGMHMMAEVPTGVGKTAASLSVALEKSLDGMRVVFLTPRHSQHMIVLETVKRINEKGFSFKIADLIGKKWMCNIEGVDFLSTSEFNDYCRLMRKDERCEFYNATWKDGKMTEKAVEFVSRIGGVMDAEELKRLCREFCPYEIAIHLSRNADVIVADYFHLFSSARQSFIARTNLKPEETIIIVDEAHNLPGRIRDQMTRKLSLTMIERGIKEAKLFGFFDEASFLSSLRTIFKGNESKLVTRSFLLDVIERHHAVQEVVDMLVSAGTKVKEERKRSYLFSIGTFIDEWVSAGDGFARIYKPSRKEIILQCLDPSPISSPIFSDFRFALLMSATLRPGKMYSDLLGINAIYKRYPSPFPSRNRMDVVVNSVTTRFSEREDNLGRIAMLIRIIMDFNVSSAFFFPSYEFMHKIYSELSNHVQEGRIVMEKQQMSKQEKTSLYRMFMSREPSHLFGVVSGSFAEGVDYPGNKIKIVTIVGLPLARPDLETKSLIDYYQRKFGKGWEYGYTFPAMIRAIQAAGRSIRSETDRGIIIYLDQRYLWKQYREFLPDEITISPSIPTKKIEEFLAGSNLNIDEK